VGSPGPITSRSSKTDRPAGVVDFWIEAMNDATEGVRERLEAPKLLATRGWGKPPAVVLIEEKENEREAELEAAVERFPSEVVPLAAQNRGESADDCEASSRKAHHG
jgi:hypothetical protein